MDIEKAIATFRDLWDAVTPAMDNGVSRTDALERRCREELDLEDLDLIAAAGVNIRKDNHMNSLNDTKQGAE